MTNANNKITHKKPKLVRDSFTIPKAEFVLIEDMKTRALALGVSVKKSELLRAGLKLLQGLNDKAYKAALAAVPTLKTGRPSSEVLDTDAVKPVEKKAVRKKSAAVAEAEPAAQASPQKTARRVSKTVAAKAPVPQSAVKAKAPKAAAPATTARQTVAKAPAFVPVAEAQSPTPRKARKPAPAPVAALAPVHAPAPTPAPQTVTAPAATPVEASTPAGETTAKA